MWIRWGVLLLAGCSSGGAFLAVDAGRDVQVQAEAEDARASKDAQPAEDAQVDALQGPADTGVDAVVPLDAGPPVADAGPDVYVAGRCFVPNNGSRSCVPNVTMFRVRNPDSGATTPCDQITPPCPLGWSCEWQPNGQMGTCIP